VTVAALSGCLAQLNGGDGGALGGEGGVCAQDVPSKQVVTFRIQNTSTSERWILEDGFGWPCEGFSIAHGDGAAVHRLFTHPIVCEGSDSGPPIYRARRLAPGESAVVTWDARTWTACQEDRACDYFGDAHSMAWIGAAQPVGPGAYRVTVHASDVAPVGCADESDAGDWRCNTGWPSAQAPFAAACSGGSPVVVSFTLPASGDVDVSVPLP